jgi:putative transposase
MVKENIEKLNPQIKERYQSLKIRIYPNKEQKLKLDNFFNIYRLVYNTAISCIKEENKTNFIYIRKKVFEKINKKYNNPEWFNELYFDSKTLAIKEASNSYNSNYTKGGSFNIKYKSKHNKKQNLKIDHRVQKIKKAILKMFKMDIYMRKLDIIKLKKVFENEISDSEIIREFPGKYFLILNYKINKINIEKKIKRISIDPGIKTLSTVYTQEGILMKLGNNIQKIYKKISDRIDKLNKILLTKKGRTKKNIRKRLSKLRSKIISIVENTHNTLSSFLARSTEEIILPKLDISNIINKERRNLNKKVVKDIIYKSPYKLHCKIVDQCSKYNTNIKNITEEYTSKTCGNCLNRKTKEELKGERKYECKKCGITMDRDYNAARNIMLKYDNLFDA